MNTNSDSVGSSSGGSRGGSGSGGGDASGSGSGSSGSGMFGRGISNIIMRDTISKRPKSSYNSLVEIEVYLSLEIDQSIYECQDFDVLRWWQDNAVKCPVLSVIARALFGCPVSTVAVEQAFSAGGNILSDTRSLLHPESLEAQACVDDWTKAEQRLQGQAHLDDHDQFDVSSDDTATGGSDTEQHSAMLHQA